MNLDRFGWRTTLLFFLSRTLRKGWEGEGGRGRGEGRGEREIGPQLHSHCLVCRINGAHGDCAFVSVAQKTWQEKMLELFPDHTSNT